MRLIHGDCIEEMDKLIKEGVKVDAIITDPPYGTTACKWDSVIPFDEMWKCLEKLRNDNASVVLFGSEPFSTYLRMSNIKNFRYDWIWDKKQSGNPWLVKKQPLKTSENISVFYKGEYIPQMWKGKMRKKGGGNGAKMFGNTDSVYNDLYYHRHIIEFPNSANKRGRLHPTQKPVALLEYLIKTYTKEGDTVLDFTMGSGTTGLACKKLNRNFIGIELDENYFNIARKRIGEAE